MTGVRATSTPPRSGARYYSCALHVNPFEYLTRHSIRTAFSDEATYNVAMRDACIASGVEVVGIMDHYRVNTSKQLAKTLRSAGIHVFQGFEAVSKDGVHFLCFFDSDTTEASIDRRIGECGVSSDTELSPLGTLDALELMEAIASWKAVSVAAHAASAGGLLKKLSGKSRINAWRSPCLLACALPGPASDAPPSLRSILENKNPDYHRRQPVAIINARDVSDPKALASPGVVTAIKMSEVGVEGLKQAFLDPMSRVRLMTDPEPTEHTEFVSIKWAGGFLDGLEIGLNENLNALIGGRGSGKSTVIESIRYALDVTPIGAEARVVHESIVTNVLRPGTQITLNLRSPHPSYREYIIERTVPNPPTVRSADGALLPLKPVEVAPRVDVFGQHEISELARSPEERTRLLERFLDTNPSGAAKADVMTRLVSARSRIAAAVKARSEADDKLASLRGDTETLKRYEEAGLEEKLKEKASLDSEELLFDSASECIGDLREAVDQVRAALPIDLAFLAPDAVDALPNRDLLREIKSALDALDQTLSSGVDALEQALAKAEQEVTDVKARWTVIEEGAEAGYQATLRELQKTNVDGAEFLALRKRIARLEPLRDQLPKLDTEIRDAKSKQKELVVEFEAMKADEFRTLEKAAKQVNKRLKGSVRARVKFQGNLEPLSELLRSGVGGRLSESLDVFAKVPTLSLRGLADSCRAGASSLVTEFGILPGQAERLASASEDVLMRIEELDLRATTELELNVAPIGEAEVWRELDDLSAGQKATAVLLLLLLESDAPLLVDQPEDDLDNRFITEWVVPKMREEKRRRQFIFSTHNANIPVLGDAELILGLTPTGDAARGQATILDEHLGSIDVLTVRQLVEDVLEGGKEAFELRRLKYGIA